MVPTGNEVKIIFLTNRKEKQNFGFLLKKLLNVKSKFLIPSTESIQAGILNKISMYNCYFAIYTIHNALNKTLQNCLYLRTFFLRKFKENCGFGNFC